MTSAFVYPESETRKGSNSTTVLKRRNRDDTHFSKGPRRPLVSTRSFIPRTHHRRIFLLSLSHPFPAAIRRKTSCKLHDLAYGVVLLSDRGQYRMFYVSTFFFAFFPFLSVICRFVDLPRIRQVYLWYEPPIALEERPNFFRR